MSWTDVNISETGGNMLTKSSSKILDTLIQSLSKEVYMTGKLAVFNLFCKFGDPCGLVEILKILKILCWFQKRLALWNIDAYN